MSVTFLPNADAKAEVSRWLGPALLILLGLSIWVHPGQPFAETLGHVLPRVTLPCLVVVLVAKRMSRPWPWQWYAAAVLVPTTLLVLLTDVLPGRAAAAELRQQRQDQARHLTAPPAFGSWTTWTGAALDDPQLAGALRALEGRIGPDGQVLTAAYRSRTGRAVLVGLTTAETGEASSELAHPSRVVADVFRGMGSVISTPVDSTPVDAGPLGGTMACSLDLGPGPAVSACAWADAVTLGVVVLGGTTDLQQAGRWAREIRGGVTVVDQTA